MAMAAALAAARGLATMSATSIGRSISRRNARGRATNTTVVRTSDGGKVVVKTYEREFANALIGGSEQGNIRAARKLRTFARRKVNRKNRDGQNSSRVGEPPKRRSGTGYKSIDAVKIRRGLSAHEPKPSKTFSSKRKAPYMSMYEFGPVSLRRPWLRPALTENSNELARMMTEPVQRKLAKNPKKA